MGKKSFVSPDGSVARPNKTDFNIMLFYFSIPGKLSSNTFLYMIFGMAKPGSNPADINRFRCHTEMSIILW